MSVRKQIVTALSTMVLGLAVFSASASAQCTNGGAGGTNRINIAVGGDLGQASYNLFTRFRSTLSQYSWGRGPVGHPGTVRSSYAVLRERLGLMR